MLYEHVPGRTTVDAMSTWLSNVRWLPVSAIALIMVGFVLVVADKEYYQLATILLLAAIVLAVLSRKEAG